MFLHNRRIELVLLMTTFGMLLLFVHIQPAQALVCYDCTDVDNLCTTAVSETTKKTTCPSHLPFCMDSEIQENGTTKFVRGCANRNHVDEFKFASCDEFSDVPGEESVRMKACFCQTDLCNGELGKTDGESVHTPNKRKSRSKSSSPSRIRILTQLLLFCILVSVSAFWN